MIFKTDPWFSTNLLRNVVPPLQELAFSIGFLDPLFPINGLKSYSLKHTCILVPYFLEHCGTFLMIFHHRKLSHKLHFTLLQSSNTNPQWGHLPDHTIGEQFATLDAFIVVHADFVASQLRNCLIFSLALSLVLQFPILFINSRACPISQGYQDNSIFNGYKTSLLDLTIVLSIDFDLISCIHTIRIVQSHLLSCTRSSSLSPSTYIIYS